MSTLNLLFAIVSELAHGRFAAEHLVRASRAVFQRQLELELGEESVVYLAAERADSVKAVSFRIVLEKYRCERLRRGAADHARAARRIVFAVLGAAVNHMAARQSRRPRLVAVTDETDLTRRIRHAVRADRRIGDNCAIGPDASRPFIALAAFGLERHCLWRRLAEIEQEARSGRIRIVKDVITAGGYARSAQRLA